YDRAWPVSAELGDRGHARLVVAARAGDQDLSPDRRPQPLPIGTSVSHAVQNERPGGPLGRPTADPHDGLMATAAYDEIADWYEAEFLRGGDPLGVGRILGDLLGAGG